MRRRQFMASVSSAAIAVAVPIPALADVKNTLSAGNSSAIDMAFQIMEDYGFHQIDEKAALFSYYPGQFKDFDRLYNAVHDVVVNWGGRDHQDRIGFLLSIRRELKNRFGSDLRLHKIWLDSPHSGLGFKSPRMLMSTQHYYDLRFVVSVLEDEAHPWSDQS